MTVSEIVNVQITRETQTVSQAGFGTPLIMAIHKSFNERVKYYANMNEVSADFSSSDLVYIASQDVFAQSPRPVRLGIGRRACDLTDIEVETALSGFLYTATINGTAITVNSTSTVQESTVVLDADLVSLNSIAVSVNGNALTPIVYATSHVATMNAIAAAIALEPDIDSATVSDPDNRTITVVSDPNTDGIIDSFVVTLGASQAVATITTVPQDVTKVTIADKLATAITDDVTVPVTADTPLTPDGTLTVTPDVLGIAYTISVSTNIIKPDEARVTVTQAKPLTQYSVEINGVVISYTSTVDVQDNETIASALVVLINLSSELSVLATDNLDGSFELTDSAVFSLFVSEVIMSKQIGLIMDPFVATDSVTDDLDAIETENNDWYALAYTRRVQAEVEAIAGWIETRTKIFGTASSDLDIINVAVGTDVSSISAVLNQAGYTRSFVMYHQDADIDFPECAWFGKTLPTNPGSITWKFKTLTSISYSSLTSAQSNNARNKKTNVYQFIGGVGITREGTMAQGEYIDVIRGIDWLTARIQEYVYSLLVNSPKVPYTNAGITSVEAEIRRALDEGVSNNFITDNPEYTVTVPLAQNVSAADKGNRILRDVTFQATLAGAIHFVEINGVVSLV